VSYFNGGVAGKGNFAVGGLMGKLWNLLLGTVRKYTNVNSKVPL
jgi:hypothetical protein